MAGSELYGKEESCSSSRADKDRGGIDTHIEICVLVVVVALLFYY